MSSLVDEQLARLRSSFRSATAVAAIDLSVWIGTYPFRHIESSSIEHLRKKMHALPVDRAVVSGFDCIFAENNLDAFASWAQQLSGDASLEVWPVVRPGAMHGIERLLDRFHPRGLRLLPNYHGYRLSDPGVERIMRLAKQRRMIVQVFQRIADERWHWLLKTPAVDAEDLAYFSARYGDQPLLLSGLGSFEGLAPRIEQADSIYVDVSRLRGPVFAIERLQHSAPMNRIVFGSLWPIQMIEASLWQIEPARLDAQHKTALLRDNALRLLSTGNRS